MPDPIIEKDSRLFLLLHITLLVLTVLFVIAIVDAYVGGINFWVGLVIALLVGVAYPRVARRIGVAPAQWE